MLQTVRLGQGSVHLGAPVGKTVDLVLTGDADVMLVAGAGRIDLQVEDFFLAIRSCCHRIPEWVAGSAPSDEAKAPLSPDPINRQIEDAVLERPRISDDYAW